MMGEISQIAAQKVVVVFNGLENSVLPARIALNMLLAVQQKEAFQKLKRKPFLREPVRQTITSIIQAQSIKTVCSFFILIQANTGPVCRDHGYFLSSWLIPPR